MATGNYGIYMQPNDGTYIEQLSTLGGSIAGISYTGTVAGTNIASWAFQGYVTKIGLIADYEINSPATPITITPSTTCSFTIPYSPLAQPSAGNISAATGFGEAVFVDNLNNKYVSLLTTSATGQNYISCAFTSPATAVTVSVRCHFKVNCT